jgi:TrmH family RNA methyltransferase
MDLALPVITELQAAGVSVIASVTKGGTAMHEADLGDHVAIVIGGEGPGLSRAVVDAADRCVSIAMRPPVESLNAAVAAALLVYEARRQRDEAR